MPRESIQNVELSTDTLIQNTRLRMSEIETKTEEILATLIDMPPGKLRIHKKRDTSLQYYCRTGTSDKKGIYLSKKQDSLAARLAQKDYDSRVVHELQNEYRVLKQFLADYHPENIDEIFRSLHENRKPLIQPIRLLDEDYVKQWLHVAYEKKEFTDDAPDFYTARNERVRSKSEIIIADTMYRNNIPYRYEYPLYVDGLGELHPDFLCLNVGTRKAYIWEHFGMMSDIEYANLALRKMEKYALAGFFPGVNIIYSFENASHPLSSRIIESNIRNFLST